MTNNATTLCEACGTTMLNRVLDEYNILLQCPECGHILRDLSACNANARSHAWGGIAFFDRVRNNLTFKSLNRNLPSGGDPSNPNVLDIGFGSGLLLAKWIHKGWNSFGIEAETLDIPIEESVRDKAVLNFCKVEDTDLPDDSFDLVYAIHVAEHLDDPGIVFTKCHRMLKKGGMLYFVTPNARSLGLKWFKSAWWNLEDPTHIRFFSPDSMTHMLNDAGFTKVKTKTPAWDSIMVEANSVLRSMAKGSGEHGILSHKLARLPIMMLAVPFFFARLLCPRLSPSIETIAIK